MTEQQETLHFLDYWRVIRSRKEVIIAVSLLVVLTGILVTYAMPKVYMASTKISVRPETPDVEVFTRHITGFDPLFMRTMFEIIQSRPIITETIRETKLDEKLGAAYGYSQAPDRFERTVMLLGRSMKVQQYRDTNLIEIQIYLAEPKESANIEAARVADTIATVFREQRTRRSQEETERALQVLHSSLEEQQRRVDTAEQLVEDIRKKYEIDVISNFAGTESSADKMRLQSLEQYRSRIEVDLAGHESRLAEIGKLSPEDKLDAIPYVAGDPVLSNLVDQKRKAEVDLSQLVKSYGSKHPQVVGVQAAITEFDKKIEDALTGIQTAIRVEYQSEKAKLATIVQQLDELKAKERLHESGPYREFAKAREALEHAKTIRDSLEARYLQERIEMRIPRTAVEVIEPAHAPLKTEPVSPDFTLNLLLSIVVGLGSGIALAYFIEYLDTSVKTVDDVEKFMGVPVLGVIPQKVKPLIDEESEAAHAEAYRILRTNIRFSKRFGDGKALTITSGSASEGKSLTLFNLAYVSAKLGEKVLIVDSDLHRPTQHKMLGVDKKVGLANVLVDECEADAAIIETEVPNLYLMPSGRLKAGHHGLLDTVRMKELLEELKGKFGLVLFDAPPITGVSDASLLAREMDGVVLVIQHRKHPKGVANRAKVMVENVGANLIGVVLNNINISRDYSYYYYGHYYSYAYTRSRSYIEGSEAED